MTSTEPATEPAEQAAPRLPLRVLVRPAWLAGHVLVVVGCVVMVRLALWQWHRGEELDALRNYTYGVEWYAFVVLTVVGWLKICHDELIPDPDAGVLFGAVEPAVSSAEMASWDDDPEVAAWNAQFRALHMRHALKESGLTAQEVETSVRQQLADPDRRALS